jgi:hypothetical protein
MLCEGAVQSATLTAVPASTGRPWLRVVTSDELGLAQHCHDMPGRLGDSFVRMKTAQPSNCFKAC